MDKHMYKSPEGSPTSDSSNNFTPTVSSNLSFPSSTVTSNCMYQSKKLSSPIPKMSTSQTSKLVQNSEKATSPVSANGVSPEGASGGRSLLSGSGGFKSGMERKTIAFGLPQNKINLLKQGVTLTNSSKFGTTSSAFGNGASSRAASSSPISATTRNESNKDRTVKLVPYNDDEESDSEGVRASLSSKRLKSPEAKKQSPKRNGWHEYPITPPKTPRAAGVSPSPSSNPRTPSPTLRDRKIGKHNSDSTALYETSSHKQKSEQRDGVKRKAPSDDDEDGTPRKSRSTRRRQSSSTDTSSRSASDSPDGKSKTGSRKRRRSEESNRSQDRKSSSSQNNSSTVSNGEGVDQNSRRERDSISRDSFSQERDRERRKDRNPSPSFRGRRASSTDRKQSHLSEGSSTFDVSRLRNTDSIVGWDGQKSFFSKAVDEHRKKSSEKDYDEEYNDNFDEGRVKKVRRSASAPRESSVLSKFQEVEDRKKQVDMLLAKTNLGGIGPGSNRRGSDSKSWSNGEIPRHRRSNSNSSSYRSESSSTGNGLGVNESRPRHSNNSNNSHSNNSSTNYSKNSHGRRSPFKNGHHSNGGSSHYRSQSHSSYHHHNNKHWGSQSRH